MCDGKPATIVGSSTTTVLVGTPGRDVIVGAGGNEIQALGGNDLICSPTSTDNIDAGAGDDKVIGGYLIVGGPGRDTILTTTTEPWIWGGPGDDRIIASAITAAIFGESGNDFIESHDSVYVTSGGEGDDVIVETHGSNTVGGPGNDVLIARGDRGTLLGGPGNDVSMADPGASVNFFDDEGDDVYYGADNPATAVNFHLSPNAVHVDLRTGLATGNGNDRLIGIRSIGGSHKPDVLIGDSHANTIRALWDVHYSNSEEDPGADYIRGLGGDDTIVALGAGTRAFGDGGNDTVAVAGHGFGGRGNDVLTGGPHDDTLIGGPGFDHVDGAAGTDFCSGERLVNCELR